MIADTSIVGQIVHHSARPVEKFVRTKARLHLLDWMGCVAGARRSDVARIEASVSGSSAVERACWLGNVLEMDDVHRTAILHPGPVVWPAALAAAGASMDDLLSAAVRGYEAMISVGSLLDARHYSFWHNTATAGGFGAAMAAADLMGCTPEQRISALGLAGSVMGGFWQMRHEPVMAKQWHLAHVVRTGIEAARHAAAGITGPRYILEGPQGIFAATCDAPRTFAPGDGWAIDAVSFKPWGACRHAHPAIDAALELKAQGKLDGPVRVRTYRDAMVFCDRPNPSSVIDAKFSLQHAVAIVAERGIPQLADFEPDAIAALAGARALVTVEEGADFTARYPAHFGCEVATGSGTVTLIDTRGDPERPLADDGVIGKALALMAWGGISRSEADGAVDTILHSDRTEDVIELLEAWL